MYLNADVEKYFKLLNNAQKYLTEKLSSSVMFYLMAAGTCNMHQYNESGPKKPLNKIFELNACNETYYQ